jgi:PKD repeat protein
VPFQNTSNDAVSYQWLFPGGTPAMSNEATPTVTYTASGVYAATLIATNAVGSDTVQQDFVVEVRAFPVAAFTYTDLGAGPAVQFNFSGSSALLYQWDFGDGSPISDEVSPLHDFPGTGTYTVRLVVQNECGASILELPIEVVDETIATDGPAAVSGPMVWPNPTTGKFRIAPVAGMGQGYVLDMEGRVLQRLDLVSGDCCAIWDLPAGVYGLHLTGPKGTLVLKLVKL